MFLCTDKNNQMLCDNSYKHELMVFPTTPKQSWLPLMPIRIGNCMLVERGGRLGNAGVSENRSKAKAGGRFVEWQVP